MDRISNPRDPQLVKTKLAEVEELKRRALEHRAFDPASELLVASMEAEESALRRELLAGEALAQDDLRVALDGGTVVGHSIGASVLANVLTHVQGLVNAVAQVKLGEPTDRAPIPAAIASDFRFNVTAFAPGSFVVAMRLPEKPEQLTMEPGSSRNDIIDTVAHLFTEDAVEGKDHVDAFLRLVRHRRVRAHYSALLKAVEGDAAEIRWSTRTRPEPIVFTKEQAVQRIEWLSLQGERVDEVVLTGVLDGGRVEARKFDLMVGDELYSGRVAEEAVELLKTVKFGATVEATLRIVTRYHEDEVGMSKTTYELVDVHMP